MKPGTGTNPIYARKHGHEIQNTLDQVLYDLCDDYRPTGARNSLDALEMLVKEHPRVELPRPRQPQAEAPPKPAREYAPQPGSYGATFGFVQQRQAAQPAAPAAPPPPPPKKPTLEDLPKILGPSHGWSEQDSQRHLQVLEHLQASSPQEATSKAYGLANDLSEQAFTRGNWATLAFAGSLLAGLASLAAVAADPGMGLLLLGGSGAGFFSGSKLHKSASQDEENSRIARDMAWRVGSEINGFTACRPANRGNYAGDFQP